VVGERKIDDARNSYRSARRAGGRIGHWGGAGRHAGGCLGRRFPDFHRRDGFVADSRQYRNRHVGHGDFAIALGDGANASALGGPFDIAFADGAGSTADTADGYLDFASANGASSIAGAGYGNFDAALTNGTDSGALASGDVFNNTTLIPGNDDFAFAWGPHTIASSGDLFSTTSSSGDIATVFDPFGTMGSDAYAGIGNFDLAAIFGDGFSTDTAATGGNFLVDILPML
jgi:hypothetical protein